MNLGAILQGWENDFPTDTEDFLSRLLNSSDPSTEPLEMGLDLKPNEFLEFAFEHDNHHALILPESVIKHEKQSIGRRKPVPLSQSVGIGLSQNVKEPIHQISLSNPLEETFRARYKSDYFSQNGRKRRPRYVADREGNHFVTIKVPVGLRGQIRVDWLTTPTETGDLYYMPYRFQKSNDSSDIADCNPIHFDIESNTSGTVKLYIVLIKAKQDELKSLQPLKPFRPLKDAFGIPDDTYTKSVAHLTPKNLIQRYKLNTSQLAFTYCTISSDGTPIPEWNTTVYSTFMTELPTESSNRDRVSCPRCTHVFQLPEPSPKRQKFDENEYVAFN